MVQLEPTSTRFLFVIVSSTVSSNCDVTVSRNCDVFKASVALLPCFVSHSGSFALVTGCLWCVSHKLYRVVISCILQGILNEILIYRVWQVFTNFLGMCGVMGWGGGHFRTEDMWSETSLSHRNRRRFSGWGGRQPQTLTSGISACFHYFTFCFHRTFFVAQCIILIVLFSFHLQEFFKVTPSDLITGTAASHLFRAPISVWRRRFRTHVSFLKLPSLPLIPPNLWRFSKII